MNVSVSLSLTWFVLLTCSSCLFPSLHFPVSQRTISIVLVLITHPEALRAEKVLFRDTSTALWSFIAICCTAQTSWRRVLRLISCSVLNSSYVEDCFMEQS